VTPPLTGTILPGITRDSVITLARAAGAPVEERPVSFDEWRTGRGERPIREAFACGTAAVITPIGTVRSPAASSRCPTVATARWRRPAAVLLWTSSGAAPRTRTAGSTTSSDATLYQDRGDHEAAVKNRRRS
jgi:hypothetical protein